MVEFAISNPSQIESQESLTNGSKEGELQGTDKTYCVTLFENTEEASAKTFEFLQSLAQPEDGNPFLDFSATYFSSEMVEMQTLIDSLLTALMNPETEKGKANEEKTPDPQNPSSSHNTKGNRSESLQKTTPSPSEEKSSQADNNTKKEEQLDSIFALSRMFGSHKIHKEDQHKESPSKSQNNNDDRSAKELPAQAPKTESSTQSENSDRFKDPEKEREREGNKDQQQDNEDEPEEKNPFLLKKDKTGYGINRTAAANYTPQKRKIEDSPWNIKAAIGSNDEPPSKDGHRALEGMDNIYIRFMALMARILGQAEASAHDLYLRIKERTDNIDRLSALLGKINLEKGDIDWSKNEEMKKLVDEARALGAEIPAGKYSWKKDEKALLKENIQMKKDGMEKISQLERTDMQRYLQEASQCHQARSNILKVIKEVGDTFIHNIRPN